jgi:hypothetical protein
MLSRARTAIGEPPRPSIGRLPTFSDRRKRTQSLSETSVTALLSPSSPIGTVGLLWLAWGAYWWLASLRVKRDDRAEPATLRAARLALLAAAFVLTFELAPLPPLRHVLFGPPWTWLGVPITAAALAFAVWARVHLGAYWSGRITVKEGWSSRPAIARRWSASSATCCAPR